jgi:hypothetical protein
MLREQHHVATDAELFMHALDRLHLQQRRKYQFQLENGPGPDSLGPIKTDCQHQEN